MNKIAETVYRWISSGRTPASLPVDAKLDNGTRLFFNIDDAQLDLVRYGSNVPDDYTLSLEISGLEVWPEEEKLREQ